MVGGWMLQDEHKNRELIKAAHRLYLYMEIAREKRGKGRSDGKKIGRHSRTNEGFCFWPSLTSPNLLHPQSFFTSPCSFTLFLLPSFHTSPVCSYNKLPVHYITPYLPLLYFLPYIFFTASASTTVLYLFILFYFLSISSFFPSYCLPFLFSSLPLLLFLQSLFTLTSPSLLSSTF